MDPFQRRSNRILSAVNLVLLIAAIALGPSVFLFSTLVVTLVLTTVLQVSFGAAKGEAGRDTREREPVLDARRRYVAEEGALSTSLDAPRRLLLAHLILYPSRSRRRVRETIDMTAPEIKKLGVMEISLAEIPDDVFEVLPEVIHVPLMRPRKERMVTSLEVKNMSGHLLPTLTREEALICEVQLARDLFIEAFGLPVDVTRWPDGVGGAFLMTVESFMRDPTLPLMDLHQRNTFRQGILDEVRGVWSRAGLASRGDGAKVAEETLCELIRLTSTRSVVIAIVPKARRVILSYSYQIPHLQVRTLGRTTRISRAKSLARRFLGIEPLVMSTSVEKAKSCQSYQLQLIAPPDTRFYSIDLVRRSDGVDKIVRVPQTREADVGGEHFRISGQGTRVGHFHSRQLGQVDAFAHLDARLIESPPGAVGRSVLTAAATAGFVFLGSVVSQRASAPITSAASVGLIVSALPLALTGVAFATRGRASDRRFMSLFGYLYAWWIFFLGIAAAGLLVFEGVGAKERSPLGSSLFDVRDVWWSALLRTALASLLIISYVHFLRRVRYQRLVDANARAAEDFEGMVGADD